MNSFKVVVFLFVMSLGYVGSELNMPEFGVYY